MTDKDPALDLARKTFALTMFGIALYVGAVFGWVLF